MLLSGGIGLIVFVSFPVAPPRLADLGMVDTVSVASEAYRVFQPHMFTNQYAALPSLHVGWGLIIGLALFAAARAGGRGRLVRGAALGMPVAMVVAVVLTANHYIVDAVAGAVLTATCWVVVERFARRRAAAGTAAPQPAPHPATGRVVAPATADGAAAGAGA
jgi:membrane-associated phospholipid phosphatase